MKAVYFGGDITNPTSILRINSFRKAGVHVSSFTFRRRKFNSAFEPDWQNYHLGYTADRNYSLRILAIMRACWIVAQNKRVFDGADFLYARMIDMALIAQFAKWWFGLNSKLVYEIEDVQAVFFKKTNAGRFFRWVERRILARAQLLVVLSPGFVRGYLAPIQGYEGPFFVLENKLQLPSPDAPTSELADRWRTERDRWIIGWFGTLRCARSMSLLSEIAARLGDRVEIRTRGFPTETGLAYYLSFVEAHPNWSYGGEYSIPKDLEEMYGSVHFSWCFDFLDAGGNSNLLLACRMYQGGYYGSVPLISKDSEMERFLAPHGIGHAFAEPIAESISTFLEGLTWTDYEKEREKMLNLRRELFLDTGADMPRLIAAIREAPQSLTMATS
ncbi:MAG: glucosyltransferase [Proteobacteria bacterium]|nr:glucosyltransferase [Pseudomonadota bacterium]